MNRFLIALALLATFACAPVSAQTINVQHDGVAAFCATNLGSINGSTWNFTGDCGTPPPFNPPNDPNALSSIIGKFASDRCTTFTTGAGQSFGEVFGRLEGGNAVINTWPFRPNSSMSFAIPNGVRYYGGVIQMPANPGTAYHALKFDPYGGSCRPAIAVTLVQINWRVVGVGSTAAPTGACSGVRSPDSQPFVYLRPSVAPATDNLFMCNLRPIGLYRVIFDPQQNQNVTVIVTFN